jgi:hypothetical protein
MLMNLERGVLGPLFPWKHLEQVLYNELYLF